MAKRPVSVLTGKPSFVSSAITTLKSISLYLHLGTPILPGQNIVFWWESDLLSFAPLDLGTVTISLVFIDEFGNIDASAPLYSNSLSRADSQKISQKSFTSNLIVIDHLSDEIAKRVFKVGAYKIRLVLSGTGKDGPYESGDILLTVQLPTVDNSWWIWTTPLTRQEQWKQQYILSGNFINMSLTSVTASVTLRESSFDEAETPIDNFMLQSLLGSGQNSAVTFKPITQNWKWFEPVVFVTIAPNEKQFRYVIRLDITDQFGNAYPPFFNNDMYVTVDVKVSDDKLAADVTALLGLQSAAMCLVMAVSFAITGGEPGWILAGIWATAATIAAGVAEVVGAAASDPPVPDPSYRLLFQPIPLSIDGLEKVKPFSDFLRRIVNIAAHVEAILQTDSRLAGAYSARDRRAISLQTRHFRSLTRKLTALAGDVRGATRPTAKWFANYQSRFSQASLESAMQQLSHNLRLRGNLQKSFVEAGGTAAIFETITAQIATPEFATILSNPAPLMLGIGQYAGKLAKTVGMRKPTLQTMPSLNHAVQKRRRKRRSGRQ